MNFLTASMPSTPCPRWTATRQPILSATGSASNVVREGYASVFYPDARDLAGAGKIRVAGGEQAQANIALTLEPFQSVTATVTMPKASFGSGDNVAIQVMDAQSHPLPYTAQYDASTRSVQTALPDGSYSFLALSQANEFHVLAARGGDPVNLAPVNPRVGRGETSFTVAGHALPNLHIAMSEMRGNPIQVTVERGTNAASPSADMRIFVTLSQTGGGLADGMVGSYAEGSIAAPLETQSVPPGSYWVIQHLSEGAMRSLVHRRRRNLAHEPLLLGIAGTAAPLVLALRDDCGRLTLSLPGSVGLGAGEEPFYTVYAVPDFDSTEDVVPQTLRPSTGGKITLTGLTPGNYHVYTFNKPMALEYRNPAVLAALHGQAVAVAPTAETDLTVEVPQR